MVEIKCICGCESGEISERQYNIVTAAGETLKALDNLQIITCKDCGIIRQYSPPYSDIDTEQFYAGYEPTGQEYHAKTYEHDRGVAKKRRKAYSLGSSSGKVLDVGSGSGAFVDECRSIGVEAYGCEIAKYTCAKDDSFVYRKRFEDIHFPTDHFETVTCHDVLEHVIDVKTFIDELFRVTAQQGHCIIDFPNYFSSDGDHHWKKEHIWYFNAKQLKKILEAAGFEIYKIKRPIPSKKVFYCRKPEQRRPKILLPPGFGDSYWSVIKLKSFLEENNLGLPDVYIACPRDLKHNGHERSFPFLEMFPFLHVAEETRHANGPNKKIWNEAYAKTGRTVFKDILECDYFIAYNGHLRVGKRMEDIDKYDTHWSPPMFVSLEQEKFQKECREKYGKYIVFYFPHYGTFIHWSREFPIARVAEYINKVCQASACTPVFAGAKWDSEDQKFAKIKRQVTGYIDLTGQTSVQQLFGLMKGSELVVGYPSGLTILAATLGLKTLTIWNDYYNRQFAWHCVQDEVKNKTYFIENTKGLTPDSLVGTSMRILNNEDGKRRKIIIDHDNPKLNPPDQLPPQVIEPKIVDHGAGDLVEGNGLTIACVLKTGGVFGRNYVSRLRGMLERTVKINYQFVVLSDLPNISSGLILLKNNYPGWWSKLELFNLKGPVLYLDLDTVIVNDITDLAKKVLEMEENEFRMLIPFNPSRKAAGSWASGIMAWHGDFRYLLDDFKWKGQEKSWDQIYIFRTLEKNGISIKAINDFASIYSYKRHCVNGVPNDAEIVCFHGVNKPHTMRQLAFVQEHWR